MISWMIVNPVCAEAVVSAHPQALAGLWAEAPASGPLHLSERDYSRADLGHNPEPVAATWEPPQASRPP